MRSLRRLLNTLAVGLTIAVFSTEVQSATECAAHFGSCDYYACRIQKNSCGDEGYFEKFAHPYCVDYKNDEAQYTEQGQEFLRTVRTCLQRTIDRHPELNCKETEHYGFASHIYCYVESGFCELPPSDVMRIGWTARSEVLKSKQLTTFKKIMRRCYDLKRTTQALNKQT